MHRRRINTEEKAKVVASVWEEEFIPFLAALTVLPRTIFKNRMNSSLSFKSSWCNSSYYSKSSQAKKLAQLGMEYILPPKQKRRPLPFLLSSSFFYSIISTGVAMREYFIFPLQNPLIFTQFHFRDNQDLCEHNMFSSLRAQNRKIFISNLNRTKNLSLCKKDN